MFKSENIFIDCDIIFPPKRNTDALSVPDCFTRLDFRLKLKHGTIRDCWSIRVVCWLDCCTPDEEKSNKDKILQNLYFRLRALETRTQSDLTLCFRKSEKFMRSNPCDNFRFLIPRREVLVRPTSTRKLRVQVVTTSMCRIWE